MVDVALYEAIFAMMESMVPEFDVFGFIRERTGNIMPGITPSSIHTSADGKHVQIGANGDAIFKRFMMAIGREDLADDPALASNDGRDLRRDELYGVIDRWADSLPLDALMQTLNQAAGAGQPHLQRRRHVQRPAIPRSRDVPPGQAA